MHCKNRTRPYCMKKSHLIASNHVAVNVLEISITFNFCFKFYFSLYKNIPILYCFISIFFSIRNIFINSLEEWLQEKQQIRTLLNGLGKLRQDMTNTNYLNF